MSSDFTFGPLAADDGSSVDQQDLNYDYSMHENVAIDLVEYGRSRIVRNEEQFLLTTLGYLSGFMEPSSHFISGVLIGTAGSGKTHLQHQLEDLFPDSYLYQATSGSDTSIIYDDTWEDAWIASLDELQKPSEKIIEILKSLHGDDEEFTYKVTGDGRGADREVDEIQRSAIPYWFLYAQYEPDFEMWDRLLKIPVHESKEKNEGVLATKWDHSMVSFGNTEHDYMFDFDNGFKALKDYFLELPKEAWVKIPAGEPDFGNQDFVKYAKPIFDTDRSETNRVGAMVANLVRASALLNHRSRSKKTIKQSNEGVKEAIIAEPQDLANVLGTRDILMATTHQLDRKKKAICVAIEQTGGTRNMSSVTDIQEHLRKTNASFVKRHQIEQMLEDLIQNYLVERHERAGENGAHLYEFKGWQSLGKFVIDDDFKEFFEGCVDPITGEEFIETARRINDELEPTASDFMSDTEVDTSNTDSGQVTLGSKSTEFEDVSLEPYEESVRAALENTLDGERIDNLDEHEPGLKEMLGIVRIGHSGEGANIEGTIFDPDHESWAYGPDDWVETPQQAERQIEAAIRKLAEEGIYKTTTIRKKGNQPLTMKVSVASAEDIQ